MTKPHFNLASQKIILQKAAKIIKAKIKAAKEESEKTGTQVEAQLDFKLEENGIKFVMRGGCFSLHDTDYCWTAGEKKDSRSFFRKNWKVEKIFNHLTSEYKEKPAKFTPHQPTALEIAKIYGGEKQALDAFYRAMEIGLNEPENAIDFDDREFLTLQKGHLYVECDVITTDKKEENGGTTYTHSLETFYFFEQEAEIYFKTFNIPFNYGWRTNSYIYLDKAAFGLAAKHLILKCKGKKSQIGYSDFVEEEKNDGVKRYKSFDCWCYSKNIPFIADFEKELLWPLDIEWELAAKIKKGETPIFRHFIKKGNKNS